MLLGISLGDGLDLIVWIIVDQVLLLHCILNSDFEFFIVIGFGEKT